MGDNRSQPEPSSQQPSPEFIVSFCGSSLALTAIALVLHQVGGEIFAVVLIALASGMAVFGVRNAQQKTRIIAILALVAAFAVVTFFAATYIIGLD